MKKEINERTWKEQTEINKYEWMNEWIKKKYAKFMQ